MIGRVALMAIPRAVFEAPGTASADLARGWNRPSCCAAGAATSAPLEGVLVDVAAAVVLLLVGMLALVVRAGGPEERGHDEGGGPGGPGPGSPRPRGGGPLTAEPDWWSDFERRFAAYVMDRGTRARSSSASSLHEPGGRDG
jgi:hypothetical protein